MELTLNSMRRPAQMLARRAKKPAPEQVAEDELAAVPEEADAVVPEEEAPAEDASADDELLDDPSLDPTIADTRRGGSQRRGVCSASPGPQSPGQACR